MFDSSLVQVIQTLGKQERSDLLRWIESPFVNRRTEVFRLCQHLCQTVPIRENIEIQHLELRKKDVYDQVFKPEIGAKQRAQKNNRLKPIEGKLSPAEDSALRYVMSFLFTAVKQWMAWREWSNDEVAAGLMLCRFLRKRELTGVFEKEFKSLEIPSPQVRQSADFSLAQYQLQFERWEFNHKQGQTNPVQLQKMANAFGTYVAIIALRHGCAALDKSGLPFESIDYLPETLAKVQAGYYQDVPSVQVYYYCFRLMQTHAETDFQQLKALLWENSDIFPVDEIRDAWLVAINFCIRKLNTGERAWVREAFGLYRSGLERNLLLENGKMPKASYQNIMLLAIASEEWSWARQFLDDYRSALAIGERYNAFQFNLALWHFRRKDYPEAQEILRKVEFRDVYYNLDARRMMVRMYYDEGAVSALDSLLHSFRTYLLRHRNIGYHRDLNVNFVRTVQQILRLNPGDEQTREQLRQKIGREKYLAEREWLAGILG